MNKKWIFSVIFIAAAVVAGAVFLVKNNCTQCGIETSRLAVIQSVVDNGTFDITHSIFRTPDKAFLDGRYYGDKPPLLTFLSMGEYYVLAKVFGITFQTHYNLVIYLIYLPYFLIGCSCAWLFYLLLNRYAGNSSTGKFRITAAILSVISTLVLSYSVTISNHVPSAALLLWLILQMDNTQKSQYAAGDILLCGIIAGLLFNCEFVIGGAFAAGVFFFVVTGDAENFKQRIRRAMVYSSGVLALVALEGVLNYISYNSPLPLYLLTHKPDMAHKDYLLYAWNILFGFEGFFLYMPACLFIFPVLCRKFPGRDRVCYFVLGSVLLAALVFIIATSDYGGFCYGYRFMIPFAPVLLLYIFLSFQVQRKRNLCSVLFAAALAWGVVTAFFGTMNPWNSGYEGSLTKKGNFNEEVRNGFLGNVYVFCYEKFPDSALTRFFIERVYTPPIAWLYLCEELINRNEYDKLKPAIQYFKKNYLPELPG